MPVDLDKFWLVLHKCRGEPCFDICTSVQVEDEVLFVTSTGHGCYPVATWRVGDLPDRVRLEDCWAETNWASPELKDMFTITKATVGDKAAAKAEAKAAGSALLGKLGLGKAPPPSLTFG